MSGVGIEVQAAVAVGSQIVRRMWLACVFSPAPARWYSSECSAVMCAGRHGAVQAAVR